MVCVQRTKNSMQQSKQILMNTIGKINIIPQDIGRVLLNLYNNAFYAIDEKKKMAMKITNQLFRFKQKK